MAMSNNDFYEFLSTYVRTIYGKDFKWEIEISTKKKRGVNYGLPGGDNLYTMYVIKDGKIEYKSDEFKGYNKSVWTGPAYAKFVTTLKPVERD